MALSNIPAFLGNNFAISQDANDFLTQNNITTSAFNPTQMNTTNVPSPNMPVTSNFGDDSFTGGNFVDPFKFYSGQGMTPYQFAIGRNQVGLTPQQSQDYYNALNYMGGFGKPGSGPLQSTPWTNQATQYLQDIAGSAIGQYNTPNVGSVADPNMWAAPGIYNNINQFGGNMNNPGEWQNLYNTWKNNYSNQLNNLGYTPGNGTPNNQTLSPLEILRNNMTSGQQQEFQGNKINALEKLFNSLAPSYENSMNTGNRPIKGSSNLLTSLSGGLGPLSLLMMGVKAPLKGGFNNFLQTPKIPNYINSPLMSGFNDFLQNLYMNSPGYKKPVGPVEPQDFLKDKPLNLTLSPLDYFKQQLQQVLPGLNAPLKGLKTSPSITETNPFGMNPLIMDMLSKGYSTGPNYLL